MYRIYFLDLNVFGVICVNPKGELYYHIFMYAKRRESIPWWKRVSYKRPFTLGFFQTSLCSGKVGRS